MMPKCPLIELKQDPFLENGHLLTSNCVFPPANLVSYSLKNSPLLQLAIPLPPSVRLDMLQNF